MLAFFSHFQFLELLAKCEEMTRSSNALTEKVLLTQKEEYPLSNLSVSQPPSPESPQHSHSFTSTSMRATSSFLESEFQGKTMQSEHEMFAAAERTSTTITTPLGEGRGGEMKYVNVYTYCGRHGDAWLFGGLVSWREIWWWFWGLLSG